MPAPDPHGSVIELKDYELQELLIARLDEGCPPAWRQVAEASGIFSDHDMLKLGMSSAPSWEVLEELHNKLCTVAILCDLLERCQLYEILALLKDREPVVIKKEPCDFLPQNEDESHATTYVPLGGQLHLECHASGLPPPQFAWFNENRQLLDQTTEILCVKDFQLEDEGDYYCCASQTSVGSDSEVLSQRVTVLAQPQRPSLLEQPAGNVSCREGDELTLTCVVSGHPPPSFQWYHENALLSGQTSRTLHIPCIKVHHKGFYRCYIHNVAGDLYSKKSLVNVFMYASDVDGPAKRVTPIEKVALIITNDNYEESVHLIHPVNDAVVLAKLLGELGFKVVAMQNLTQIEMRNAVKMFCQLLPEGAYGLFYFAGHGFEMQDKYMLPIDAPGPETYLRVNSLCEKEVIRDVLNTKPRLFVILLDMCLRVPNIDENPHIHGEVPEVFQYRPERNLIQGYATTSNLGAYERGTESNGIYVKHLKEVLLFNEPINKILDRVGLSISKDADDVARIQMPSHSENVVECFYLSDEAMGNERTETLLRELNRLPRDTEMKFNKARVVAKVEFVQKNCFHNVLEIRVRNLEEWSVTCRVDVKEIRMEMEREANGRDKYLVITVYNLQKIRIPLMLTISLHDRKTCNLIDNGMLEVGLPLIAPNRLWFAIRQTKALFQ